ncbi:MAG: DUF2267 domain-containing protein [Rhodobiaceae bacterium]|nr:DUF2267 domain-containing protein [Rhodobiaceae bacterium]
MPMPQDYARAGEDFDAFLTDARDALDFATRNQTYTTVQAVFLAFRRRLTADQVLRFAGVLPPVLRAIFVADCAAHPPEPFPEDREALVREVMALRKDHNFSPDNAIEAVAGALRRHVDEKAFDAVLADIGPEAARFWQPD